MQSQTTDAPIASKQSMFWYYKTVLKKYATFSGRAGRSEYWYFILCNALISIGVSIVGGLLHAPLLSILYSFAVFIPSYAVAVRRIHDVDKSAWFVLIPIYNLILLITNGTSGPNAYGDDPNAPGPKSMTQPNPQLA